MLAVKASPLEALHTDDIDIFYVHWYDWDTSVQELMTVCINLCYQARYYNSSVLFLLRFPIHWLTRALNGISVPIRGFCLISWFSGLSCLGCCSSEPICDLLFSVSTKVNGASLNIPSNARWVHFSLHRHSSVPNKSRLLEIFFTTYPCSMGCPWRWKILHGCGRKGAPRNQGTNSYWLHSRP